MSTATTESPMLTLRPPSRWSALNLGEVWDFRDLLWSLALKDLKVRYKQTILGAIWVILIPLIGAGLLTFVFGVLGDMPSDFKISFVGTTLWSSLFAATLTKSSGSLVGNAALVTKVYFPRLVLPFSTVISTLVDFGVSMVVVAVLMVAYGIAPTAGILLAPVIILLVIMFGLGVGLYSASLMVSYRDIRYVLPILVQFGLFISPVGYQLSAVSEKMPDLASPWGDLLGTAYMLNPMASLLEVFRWSILGDGHAPWGWVAYSMTVCVVVFVVGTVSFKRMERKFADVI